MGNLLSRVAQPRCPLYLETINGARALDSPYLTWLRDHFDLVADSKRVTVYRKST
jgi:hypothetical protein